MLNEMNFLNSYEACCQLENLYASEIDMAAIREPVWAYLRQHCNSFATMSDYAGFSDIFTLNTVGEMTQKLKPRFLIQQTDQSICTSCNNSIVKEFIPKLRSLPKPSHGIAFWRLVCVMSRECV